MPEPPRQPAPTRTFAPGLAAAIAAALLLRAWNPHQPLTENAVGRQIPTAMVARNLERERDFLHPRLDTAPVPNLFLVEPPVFAALAAALRLSSERLGAPLSPEAAGRLLSAFASAGAVAALAALLHPRLGAPGTLAAAWALALFPIAVRYGRAFQGDALAVAAALAALALADRALASQRPRARFLPALAAWSLFALAAALKIVFVPAFAIPLLAVARERRTPPARIPLLILLAAALALALLPALAWYLRVFALDASAASASRAAEATFAIWLAALLPSLDALREWLRALARVLLLRGFTPLALPAIAAALLLRARARARRASPSTPEIPFPPLVAVALAAALLNLAILAAKARQEYYSLVLAPPLAAALGWAWATLVQPRPRAIRVAAAAFFAAAALLGSASTWREPEDWRGLPQAAEILRRTLPPDALPVAVEALVYQIGDRPGYRLEHDPPSARRAALELPLLPEQRAAVARDPEFDAIALVRQYARAGATHVADFAPPGSPVAADPRRLEFRSRLRNLGETLLDTPAGLLLVRIRTNPQTRNRTESEPEP